MMVRLSGAPNFVPPSHEVVEVRDALRDEEPPRHGGRLRPVVEGGAPSHGGNELKARLTRALGDRGQCAGAATLMVLQVLLATLRDAPLLQTVAHEGMLNPHGGQAVERHELLADRVLPLVPEADARGAEEEHRVAQKRHARGRLPQDALAGGVTGGRHDLERPFATANGAAGRDGLKRDLLGLEVDGVVPDDVGELCRLPRAHALGSHARDHDVAPGGHGHAAHVGEHALGDDHAGARLGELSRETGVVDVGVRAEERRSLGVHLEPHEGAHQARVIEGVGGAGVHHERLAPVKHHEGVHGGQEGVVHEKLDAPHLWGVEHLATGEPVVVERKAVRPAAAAPLLVVRGARASQRAPSRRSS